MMVQLRTMEAVGLLLYLLAGREHAWLSRVLSAICYVLSGVAPCFLVRKIPGLQVEAFAMAFYLLVSYGVVASGVQPLGAFTSVQKVYATKYEPPEQLTIQMAVQSVAAQPPGEPGSQVCHFLW
jgi:hypothetical protein